MVCWLSVVCCRPPASMVSRRRNRTVARVSSIDGEDGDVDALRRHRAEPVFDASLLGGRQVGFHRSEEREILGLDGAGICGDDAPDRGLIVAVRRRSRRGVVRDGRPESRAPAEAVLVAAPVQRALVQ